MSMRKATYTTILMIAIAGAFLAGYLYNQRDGVKAAAPTGSRILHYACPMHPRHVSDRPGQCPACGMDLVAQSEDSGPGAAAPAGSVEITAGKRQLIGVRVAPAEKMEAAQAVRLFGRVVADETRAYTVNAGIDGFIRGMPPITTGSRVTKGQRLATFSSPDLRQPVQAYFVTLDTFDRTQRNGVEMPDVERRAATSSMQLAIDRLLNLGVSPRQVEELRGVRVTPTDYEIISPADGFLVGRSVTPGQKIDRGNELFRVADLSRVWVMADVYRDEAAALRPGMEAQITLPDTRVALTGRLSEVLPQFDAASRTLKVRFEVENGGFVLRPDMFVNAVISVARPRAIVVPAEAVIDTGLRKVLFVQRGEDLFEPREVNTGWRSGDLVEIVAGLSTGEMIAVSGVFLLDSESRMKLAAKGIGSERPRGAPLSAHSPTPSNSNHAAPHVE